MFFINLLNKDLCVGKVELHDCQGVIKDALGDIIGFYDYQKGETYDSRGTFYIKGNKSIELILQRVEELKQNGIELNIERFKF